MNEYLASPVTAIVIAVVAIAISIAVILKARSKKKREAEAREREERVRRQLASELQRGKPLRRTRLQDLTSDQIQARTTQARSVIRGERSATSGTGGNSRRYDPSTDNLSNQMLIGGMFAADSTPGRSNTGDCGPSHSSSSYDGGSSSSSSSDSGSSSSSDSGGGGGGCD